MHESEFLRCMGTPPCFPAIFINGTFLTSFVVQQNPSNKNSTECEVSPVSALSQNTAKRKNSTKVYAAENDDTGKAA